jgi:hypothetical protein
MSINILNKLNRLFFISVLLIYPLTNVYAREAINPAIYGTLAKTGLNFSLSNEPLEFKYEPQKFQNEFEKIMQSYQRMQQRQTNVNRFFKETDFILDIMNAGSVFLSPKIAIITHIGVSFGKKALQNIHIKLNNSLQQIANDVVQKNLAQWRQTYHQQYNHSFKTATPEEKFTFLHQHLSPIYAELKVPKEIKSEVNHTLMKVLQDQIVSLEWDQKITAAKQQQRLDQLGKVDATLAAGIEANQTAITKLDTHQQQLQHNIATLAKGLQVQKTYHAELSTRLGKVAQTQSQLITRFNDFEKITVAHIQQNRAAIKQNQFDIAENRTHIHSLARHNLMRMSPKEQLKALELPVFDKAVTEPEKAAIKVHAQQQQQLEDLQYYANGMGSIAMIANNIGLPTEVTQVLNKTAGIASSLVSSIANFTAGNYLGGIAALSSILGFIDNRESPETIIMKNQAKIMEGIKGVLDGQKILSANQERIMTGIKGLFEGQKAIIKNQGTMLEGIKEILKGQGILADNQAKIINGINSLFEGQKLLLEGQQALFDNQKLVLENQQKITETLIKVGTTLSEQIQQNQDEIFKRFDRLERNQEFLVKLNRWQIVNQFHACERIERLLTMDLPTFIKTKTVTDLTTVIHFINEKINDNTAINNRWQNCQQGILGLTQMTDQDFNIAYQLNSFIGESTTGDVQIFMEKVYQPLLAILFTHLKNHDAIQALFNPAMTIKQLETKSFDITVKNHNRLTEKQWLSLMRHPLHSQTVLKDMQRILRIYPLLDASIDNNKIAFHPVQNFNLNNSSGYELLKELAILIDFTIAMETLIGGDLLLPILDQMIWAGEKPEREKAVNILKHNPLLSKNFTLYTLQKHLTEPSTVAGYAYAYQITDNLEPMNEVFKAPLKNKFTVDQTWFLNIDELKLAMPEPNELLAGKLIYFPTIDQLIKLRKQISQALFDYEFFATHLTATQQQMLVDVVHWK